MDVINSVIKSVIDFADKSEATYHVNPWVFCILFFGSAIPLYYGYYRIARSALKIEHGKLHRKKIDKSELKIGGTANKNRNAFGIEMEQIIQNLKEIS